jgi:hypothetical protein
MSTNTIMIAAPPRRVFDALADARTYPEWLVGAQRIRRVEEGWPAVGSSFHHTVGLGPLRVHDRTSITAIESPHLLRLDARVGPFGAADVCFRVDDAADGGSCVTVQERPDRGPMRHVWRVLGRPLMQLGLFGRNQASLVALRDFIERGGRAEPSEAGGKGSDSLLNDDSR